MAKLRFFSGLVLLLSMVLLCACSKQKTDLSEKNAPKHKVEFWTMSLKPKFIPYFEQLEKNYEARHPDVDVVWVDFPWDILQLKLITAIAAGTPPALVQLSVPWAEEMARDGLLLPVNALVAKPNPYTQGAIDDLTFKGKLYGFPHYSNVNIIAYNKQILLQAGLQKPPTSMDDLLDYAVQIYAKTGKAGYAPALGKIDGFMMQEGLDLIKDGKAVFNSPAHIALIKKLAHTYQANGFLKDKLFADDNFPAVVEAYLGGRLGMMVSAPTALRRIQADSKNIYNNTDIFPAPIGPTGIADGGWMFHFAVPKGVPEKDLPAISQFAEYLTNGDNQLGFAKIANVMPTTLGALEQLQSSKNVADNADNTDFTKMPAAEKAQAVAALAMGRSRTLYVAGVTDYDELRRFLVKAVEESVTGKRDPQAAMDEAVMLWNKKLAVQ
jgi:putative chitobiose transport system substrate-binding protein